MTAVIYEQVIPAGRPWSGVVRRGQTLRIIDSEGQQAVDALFYRADDPAERYSAQDTLRLQKSAYIAVGTRLVSNEGRVMMTVVADTCGQPEFLHESANRSCRRFYRGRGRLQGGRPRRFARGGNGRLMRALQLSANQQPLQRLQPDTRSRHHLE